MMCLPDSLFQFIAQQSAIKKNNSPMILYPTIAPGNGTVYPVEMYKHDAKNTRLSVTG